MLTALGRRRSLRDPIGAAFGEEFTPTQVHALLWLRIDGALTMGEVARRGGVTEKTITGVVDRLETAGLLERRRDADDRRVVRVRLTRKGQSTAARLFDHVTARIALLLGLLDAGERRDLFRILGTLLERLGEGADDPARREPA